jgi:hypothetical protein
LPSLYSFKKKFRQSKPKIDFRDMPNEIITYPLNLCCGESIELSNPFVLAAISVLLTFSATTASSLPI